MYAGRFEHVALQRKVQAVYELKCVYACVYVCVQAVQVSRIAYFSGSGTALLGSRSSCKADRGNNTYTCRGRKIEKLVGYE